jgi:hypothetical protein
MIIITILTIIIAIIMACIAYQQYRVNFLNLQWNLYDRRLAVVKTVREFIGVILQKAHADYNTCLKFLNDASEALFLFPDEVQDYINELYKKSIELEGLHKKLDGSHSLPNGEKRDKVAGEEANLLSWFQKQPEFSIKLFQKTMSFNKLRNWRHKP